MEPEGHGRWAEVVSSIRGSCEWCKSVVYALHLCELTVLDGVNAPLTCGVGRDSQYQQPPLILEKPATILIARELLMERSNPAPDLQLKITGLACIVAHEMAHHALTHKWRAWLRYPDVTALSVHDRRKVLILLEAPRIAKTTGIPHDVIVNHWAIADDVMQARLVGIAADESDERVLNTEDESASAQPISDEETQIHIADEWGAAVVGCMMSYRLRKGADYTVRMARSVLDDLPLTAQSGLVEMILTAPCANPVAEQTAVSQAVETLGTAFNNPDIQQCAEELRESDRDWASLFAAANTKTGTTRRG